jgi:hypothetical protein
MERFIADLVKSFETGKLSRRKLIEQLTLAATTVYAADSATAQADQTLKAQLINHISYTCPNFRQGADWYSMVFNLEQVGATNRDVALPFGKKGEQPYNVTAKDVPLTHLIVRTPDPNAARPTPPGGDRPLLPNPIDQNWWAHWRNPRDMIRQGWSTSLFQASQQ